MEFLVSYLLGLAASATCEAIGQQHRDKREKLETRLKESAGKWDASTASKSLSQRLSLGMVAASKVKASLGLSPVEEPLFLLFGDARFQSVLALWFQTCNTTQRNQCEAEMIRDMEQALRKGGAGEKHIQFIRNQYFNIVNATILGQQELANQLIIQKVNAVHEKLDAQELGELFPKALKRAFNEMMLRGWETHNLEDLPPSVFNPLMLSLITPGHDFQKDLLHEALTKMDIQLPQNLDKFLDCLHYEFLLSATQNSHLGQFYLLGSIDALSGEARAQTFLHQAELMGQKEMIQILQEIKEIMAQLAASLSSGNPSLETSSPKNHQPKNLPFQSLGKLFMGREALITRMVGGDVQALTQLKTLSGLGGIGKTRLAVEYAWRFRHEFSALLFVRAENEESLFQGLAALGGPQILNLPEQAANFSARVNGVLQWFKANESWLLIIDNIDDAETQQAVLNLLPSLEKGRVLITSRLADWPVELDVLCLETMAEDDAVNYLLAASRQRPLEEDDPLAARTLAQTLGCLPLALELAAAFMNRRRLSLSAYALEWERNQGKMLKWRLDSITQYPKSMAITWNHSFQQLTVQGRALLRVVGFLSAEPIPRELFGDESLLARAVAMSLEAGEQVPEEIDAQEALADLSGYNLISLTQEYFAVHPMVAQVMQNQIPEEQSHGYIGLCLELVNHNIPGDPPPDDVRSWPHWRIWQSHVSAIIGHGRKKPGAGALTRLMVELGLYYKTLGLYDAAEPLYRASLAVEEKERGAQHPEVAIHLNNLAALLQATNRLEEAEPLMRQALEIDRASFGHNHPKVARDLNNLAQLLQATNRLEEAEPLMRQALEIDRASFGHHHPRIATQLNNLAQLLQDTNRLEEAEPLMRQALEIDRASFGHNHPNVARDLNNLAQLLQATNRLEEAEPLMRQALEIDRASFGHNHPKVAIRLNNLAQLLQDTNRLEEAEPLMGQALEIDRASFGHHHPKVAIRLNNLAQLLQDTNRLEEAEPLMRQALEIDRASFGHNHPEVAVDLNNLAALLTATNRLEEAEPLMRQALEIDRASFGHHHPKVAIRLNNLAQLLKATNRLEEAEPLMRQALEIDRASFGHNHPNVARDLNNLAQLLQATNRLEEAEPLMGQAVEIFRDSLGPDHPKTRIVARNLERLLAEM